MTNEELQKFCEDILHADHEDEVIEILKKRAFWDNSVAWRPYGDRSGNFSTIGNQQSRPEAALVEKVVNSVDARLMNECLCAGVCPTSDKAPQSIRQAVARYFEGRNIKAQSGGTLREWGSTRRTEVSKDITIAATGSRKEPCLTIVDSGEGQSPDRMPVTFLSIDRENKLRIPFVQGKFNMGGTGALMFCGQHSIQLIISRRNPLIVRTRNEEDPSSDYWGFTVVRRERPTREMGAVKNSVYTYLAPLDADKQPNKGSLLRFASNTLCLKPLHNKAYVEDMKWGSAIKLYNYDMKGFASHILMKDGLLYRLEILLPEIALPVRLHECRNFRGKTEGSFVTTLSGIIARLEDGRGNNLEADFPMAVPFSVEGQNMVAKIYAFQKGKAETYRTNEGVIFTINGQTHGSIPKTIFGRDKVKMDRLADSLLVIVDCSDISVDAREDLFKNSRDRMSSGHLRQALERAMEDILSNHPALRALRERRREQEIADRLEDSKPLEDVLQSILKSSPSLATLFLKGQRLSNPHKRKGGIGKTGEGDKPFVGKLHPTFFRFHKKKNGEELERDAEIGRRCRVTFDTDVVNDYFERSSMPGHFHVKVAGAKENSSAINHSLTLHDGFAHWSIEIPDDLEVNDRITLECSVNDDVNSDGFINVLKLKIVPEAQHPHGRGNRLSRKEGEEEGNDNSAGIELPKIWTLKEHQWKEHGFDKFSSTKIIADANSENGKDSTVYTFYINVDNIFLRTDMKSIKEDAKLAEAKFIYGNVLIGLSLIKDYTDHRRNNNEENERSINDTVFETTRAIAPFLLPMINSLGALSDEDMMALGEIGDEE